MARVMTPILLGLEVMCWRVRHRWLSRANPVRPDIAASKTEAVSHAETERPASPLRPRSAPVMAMRNSDPGPGFVREFRPQLLATGDRSLFSARLVFVSSDRSWPQHVPESLTRAIDLPLVVANGLKPVTAVTSYEHRPRLPPPECGPKWRTFAVTSHERNHGAPPIVDLKI
jgi:hypothetical protein